MQLLFSAFTWDCNKWLLANNLTAIAKNLNASFAVRKILINRNGNGGNGSVIYLLCLCAAMFIVIFFNYGRKPICFIYIYFSQNSCGKCTLCSQFTMMQQAKQTSKIYLNKNRHCRDVYCSFIATPNIYYAFSYYLWNNLYLKFSNIFWRQTDRQSFQINIWTAMLIYRFLFLCPMVFRCVATVTFPLNIHCRRQTTRMVMNSHFKWLEWFKLWPNYDQLLTAINNRRTFRRSISLKFVFTFAHRTKKRMQYTSNGRRAHINCPFLYK